MHLFVVAVAVVTIAIGAYTNHTEIKENETKTEEVLSATPTQSPTSEPTASPSPEPTATASFDANVPTSSATATPQADQGSNTSDFVYPGANRVGDNYYTTEDSPETVTDWYKERIRSLNMSVKNFVTTTTNGKVLNKLSGADGSREVLVEITKEPGSSTVRIRIVNE